MKKHFVSAGVSLAILACGAFVIWAMGTPKQETSNDGAEKETPIVETIPVAEHAGSIDIEVDGVVTPFREIPISAEVAGVVATKAEVCRAGNFVKKGTLLIEIDPRDYDLEVRRAQKQLDQSESDCF